MFGNAHFYLSQNKSAFYIKDFYCQRTYTNADFVGRNAKGKIGPDRIPHHQVMNAEHIWPKYRFCKRRGKACKENSKLYLKQLSDLHNLIPVDSRVNSYRSHLHYGDIKFLGKTRVSCPTENINQRYQINTPSNIGHVNPEDTRSYFEPPPNIKGNVARAMFYFSREYNLPIDAIEEQFLLRWHRQDPVDKKERLVHEAIYQIQKNRNPFIDNPALVN